MEIAMKHIVIVPFILLATTKVEAFDNKVSHVDITSKAATTNINFQNYLKQNLGFEDKLNTIIPNNSGTKIIDWLTSGSDLEDVPVCRAANHFHNPIHTGDWKQSQSTDVWPQDQICQHDGWTPRYSNVTWATGLASPTDTVKPRDLQDMGWDSARTYFYNALTSTDVPTRENFFAKSFQAMGQTMHLLQDMAVPAHVRNDFLSHLIYSSIFNNLMNPAEWVANPFEDYVKRNSNLVSSILPSQIPTFAINGAIVSDFWDTDGRASAPFPQGLAESTNAGYFSDFTIPGNPHIPFFTSHSFPSPQIPNYICSDKLPGAIFKRKYASRRPCPTDGSPVDHFVAISMFTPRLLGLPSGPLPFFQKYALDDNVHNTYAAGPDGLLAKAVGYSASLLDYFFRGSIKLQAVSDGITFRSVKVTAQNYSPNNEVMEPGDVTLVVRYKALAETPLSGNKHLLSYPSDGYSYKAVTIHNVTIPRDNQAELTFDFSSDPLPMNFSDLSLQLVYKGKLGNEDGAVAVGMLPLDGIYSDFELSLPSSGVYAKTSDSSTNATFNELRVTAETDIPGGLSGGKFELALEYREATSDQFQSVPVVSIPANAAAYIVRVEANNDVSSLPQGVPVELVFDLSTVPLPVNATDVEMNVVYRKLSDNRPSAIGHNDIAEPTPVDIFNNTDFSCVDGLWYASGNDALWAADRVGNNNGVFDEANLYSAVYNNIYYKAGATGTVTPNASESNNNLTGHALGANQLLRLGYILTDYQFDYTISANGVNSAGMNTYLDSFVPHGTGFMNQQDRGWNLMGAIRGILWWPSAGAYAIPRPYPEGSICYIKDLPP
jgi:hypothetical protein